jgi:alkylhydroperoxidase family enzyme
MRTAKPRIMPVEDGEWSAEQEQLLRPLATDRGAIFNVFRTLARHPKAMRAFMPLAGYILQRWGYAESGSSISARERELLILRTAWLCRAGYEWVAHVRLSLRIGLTEAEIERVRKGSADPGWSEPERALVRAAEELYADKFVSAPTWAALSAGLSQEQCMDVVWTVGQYTQVAMLLNSFGVQLDSGWSISDSDRRALFSLD